MLTAKENKGAASVAALARESYRYMRFTRRRAARSA